jgi:hypothetical protein
MLRKTAEILIGPVAFGAVILGSGFLFESKPSATEPSPPATDASAPSLPLPSSAPPSVLPPSVAPPSPSPLPLPLISPSSPAAVQSERRPVFDAFGPFWHVAELVDDRFLSVLLPSKFRVWAKDTDTDKN